MRNKTNRHTYRILQVALLSGIILFTGCEQSEIERLTSGGDDGNVSGKLATLNISLQGIPEYNAPQGETRTARSSEPLIAEWVKVNSFDATRPIDKSGEDDDKNGSPRIALMELREDTVSNTPGTRSVMPAGVYFRLIAFRKSSDGYVFQSAADYTSGDSSSPVLQQGSMNHLPVQTYRFVAYSFNNNTPLGAFPETPYVWNETSIPIPNLSTDFLTYDSGDQTPTAENNSLALAISFTHQLCKLTVQISITEFESNTFNNCTGVYIKQGGNASSWTVGQDGIAANTNDSAPFDIADNSSATVRLVPFDSPRPVTVHFATLTVGEADGVSGIVANNLDITSSQSVQLTKGKSYTLTAQIKYGLPGIQVPESDINLGGWNVCTQSIKASLSKLRWAEGNLQSTSDGSVNDYDWTTPTEYGYYYTFMSTYTGNTTQNGTDPCTKLKPDLYGSGWRTPSYYELLNLTKCTDAKLVSNNGLTGMWFMNNPKGLFLPAAGLRNSGVGSGTEATGFQETEGNYWSSTGYNRTQAYRMCFNTSAYMGTYSFSHGYSIRCVK